MQHFSFHADGGANVVPACELPNRQHIAVPQPQISVRVSGERARDLHRLMFADHLVVPFDQIARQVGLIFVGAPLQSSRQPD